MGEESSMQEVQKESVETNNEKPQNKIETKDKEKPNEEVKIEMEEIVEETKKAETVNEKKVRMANGLYAIEVDDDLPPLDHMKFLDEAGQFKDEKPKAEEDLAYYWRKQQRKLGIVLGFSGFGLGLIILSATDKYADAAFQFMSDIFWFIINFILGLFPAGLLPF